MKKLLSVVVLTFIVVGLSGCDLIPAEYQDDVQDLICENDQVLEDGVCVDPTVDPTCEVNQVLEDGVCVDTTEDPTCEVNQVLEDGVCVDTTEDPTCDVDQTLEDGVCVDNDPTDTRSAAEKLADAIVEGWDGKLTHVDAAFNSMDFSEAMQVTSEFNLEVLDNVAEENHLVHIMVVDDYQYLETGTVMQRQITVNYDGEIQFINFIFEETATGVVVYLNIADIKDSISAKDENAEVLTVLDTLGANEDWLMFSFDDTLENVIELEVLKDMTVDIFFLQMGDTFFYDFQNMLDDELALLVPTLSTYGIDIGLFVDLLIDEDFDAAQLLAEAVDYETLIYDLDAAYLVPEIVTMLTEYKLMLDDASFSTDAQIVFLLANGTEAWLNQLTDSDISILLDVLIDSENVDPNAPDLSEMFDAYAIGELDHFIMMFFLDNSDVEMALRDIPGFDFDGYYLAMDLLDYDAYYLEVQMLTPEDMTALANAIYGGQAAFDAYVLSISTVMPETASLLSAFSGVVQAVEPYMLFVDDFNYALSNIYVFEDYLDFQYYLDQNIVTIGVAKTDDFKVETTVVFEGANTGQLFIDLFADTYSFLDGMQSFEMPIPDTMACALDPECTYLEDYARIVEGLTGLGYAEMVTVYDPSNPTEFSMVIDFTDLAQSIVEIDTADTEIIDLSFSYVIKDTSSITIPTVTSDVNAIAQDFAKVSLNFMAYDYVRNAMQYYIDNPGELLAAIGDHPLDYYGWYMNPSLAFDSEMSYITVGGDAINPTISITLYWADGTEVFNEPITLSYLDGILDGNMFPSADDYQMLLSKVDDDNWNMSKMIIVFVFTDWDNLEGEQGQYK